MGHLTNQSSDEGMQSGRFGSPIRLPSGQASVSPFSAVDLRDQWARGGRTGDLVAGRRRLSHLSRPLICEINDREGVGQGISWRVGAGRR